MGTPRFFDFKSFKNITRCSILGQLGAGDNGGQIRLSVSNIKARAGSANVIEQPIAGLDPVFYDRKA